MTLEEALAEIERQKTEISNLNNQIANADPEGAAKRADVMAKQIGELTEKLNAKDGNSKKLQTERDEWENRAKDNKAKIVSLEKQIEELGPEGVDLAQIKKDAAEAAAKETTERLRAEYKPKMDELESLGVEVSSLKRAKEQGRYHKFLTDSMKELGVNPKSYDYLISRAQGVWLKTKKTVISLKTERALLEQALMVF